MAQSDNALHLISDPMVEVLRVFYHRGLAILAQEQTEQPTRPTTPSEGTEVGQASDAPTARPDALKG